MGLAFSQTRSAVGIYAQSITVEVHLSNGLPGFTIVGLPETAVKESKDRVRSAIINSQFEFPCRRITVNLAPAVLRKSGCGFDLPIALGILVASGQIPADKMPSHEFIGELALNGDLRGVPGIIPVVLAAHQVNHCLIIPSENSEEAGITGCLGVHTAKNLKEVCAYLCQNIPLQALSLRPPENNFESDCDWSDVKGQEHAKQALIIAAAGGHSVLLSGAPGSGKTMLAKRFHTLLPILSETEALECAAIHSIRGRPFNYEKWRCPPFRSPHHTASQIALVGGGSPPKPGEISLAHHGVLFLDELPEFHRNALETLREPLESGSVSISRAAMQIEYPAKFQLLAAMNPCPCGQWGNSQGNCFCSPDKISRYLGKLSAPFLDRIDMQIQVQALPQTEMIKPSQSGNLSPIIREKVANCRRLQLDRQGCLNAHLGAKQCDSFMKRNSEEQDFLMGVLTKLKLSARAYHRLLKVARTISDLKKEESVSLSALQQALSFRQKLEAPR